MLAASSLLLLASVACGLLPLARFSPARSSYLFEAAIVLFVLAVVTGACGAIAALARLAFLLGQMVAHG